MKKLNNVLIFIFSLAAVCFFVKDINFGNYDRLLSDISIILVFFIPRIIKKIFKLKISDGLELIYIIFMIFAHFIGSIVNLYNITWWYDILMHFLSGVLTAILSLVILNWFGMYDENKKVFNFLYIIMFVLMIASIWEFLEFGMDRVFVSDVQHNLDTGVFDTMEDMLVAFLGSMIVAVTYLIGKNNIIMKIVNALK